MNAAEHWELYDLVVEFRPCTVDLLEDPAKLRCGKLSYYAKATVYARQYCSLLKLPA